jgi:hypothetical protein
MSTVILILHSVAAIQPDHHQAGRKLGDDRPICATIASARHGSVREMENGIISGPGAAQLS